VFLGYIFALLYLYFNSIWIVISFHFFWDVIARFISDPNDNKIGLMGIKDYALNSKNVDNAEVLVLGVFLILLLYFTLKKEPKNIQSYLANVIKA
jgi:membrane protease YdiL (CAAX protease family)